MDAFLPEKLGKPVRPLLQGLMGFNGESPMVFFSVMPPAVIQMRKIKVGVIPCKLIRRASNIAAVAELLSHHRIDLKRQPVSKNQMGRLQCSGERRHNDVCNLKLLDLGPNFPRLRLSKRCDGCVEYHRIRLVRIVYCIEGRLSMSNKVNCHVEEFRMLGIAELSFGYPANLG
jgi:hypothetical protein